MKAIMHKMLKLSKIDDLIPKRLSLKSNNSIIQ